MGIADPSSELWIIRKSYIILIYLHIYLFLITRIYLGKEKSLKFCGFYLKKQVVLSVTIWEK